MPLRYCPACKSSHHLKSCGSTDATLHRCGLCEHIFQDPPLVSVAYDAKYVRKYDAYSTLQQVAYLRMGFVKAFVPDGRLLDVGYGNGAFVKAALAAGFDAYGSDIHGEDYGIREVQLDDTSNWDVLTFFDSMEHFPDLSVLDGLIQRARFVVISVPCRPETFPDNLDWKHYRPGEHLHYFCVRSLQAVIRKSVIMVSNLEDAVRCGDKLQNIQTVVFGE